MGSYGVMHMGVCQERAGEGRDREGAGDSMGNVLRT
jgi:hypothetical protein